MLRTAEFEESREQIRDEKLRTFRRTLQAGAGAVAVEVKFALRRLRRLISTHLSVMPVLIPIGILLILVMTIVLITIGAYSREWEWTGFIGKTLWDWMKLLIVPIILAIGGLLFTQMDRLNARNELELNRRGQITDRFTRAIDQLGKVDDKGSKLFEVRVGGIYALEQIARDSEQEYGPVMEILTAYVRQHAPWPRQRAQEGTEDEAAESRSEELSRGEPTLEESIAPDPDIQAIVTVLGRRTHDFLHGEPERIDLHNTNLSGVDLFGASLRSANLWGTNLSGTNLISAELAWAHLQGTNLSGADLSWANLSGADLSGANLEGANLEEANLSSKDPVTERLYGEDFSDVREGANLSGANLAQANLSGADLTGAILTQAQVVEASGDEHTQLPPSLMRPAHWGVLPDEPPPED
jgi:uncharacterized protein YjbI with pentapeptide repeats